MLGTKIATYAVLLTTFLLLMPSASFGASAEYYLQVLPAEHKHMTDPDTGAELTFLTTGPARDTNLYFHERSWLADESVILFNSDRENGGLMGYLVETGELIQFTTANGSLSMATAALHRPSFYAVRGGKNIVEVSLTITVSDDPTKSPSRVTARERTICDLPKGAHTALNENCDGTKLSMGRHDPDADGQPVIDVMDIATGATREVCRLSDPPEFGGHVQWSWTDPNLISYAGRVQRLMVVDIRDGKPRNVYETLGDEHVTHEIFWVDGQMLFCGGTHPEPTEDKHVKVLDLDTGDVRIIGAGAWWAHGTDPEIAKVNWWHASGSVDGRWVAADNWHGDIMVFEGGTTRAKLLTTGHRTYGHGDHPHVGWDRSGKAVVFASHKLGNVDLCVARIPEPWQKANP